MPDPRQTIEDFYGAFARLEPDAMAACYAPQASFDDEVFSLRGRDQVMGMWRMLCDATRAHGRDAWRLEYRDVQAQDGHGQARWDAHYRFSATGRMVHNIIQARFDFDPDGRIARHRDSFDFWRWSRQALGAPGVVLGWTPLLRNSVRRNAAGNLRAWQSRQAAQPAGTAA